MSNLSEDWTKEELLALARIVKQKLADKKVLDGKWCLRCHNFSPMAEDNFPQGFLCFGCNTYKIRVILGLDKD